MGEKIDIANLAINMGTAGAAADAADSLWQINNRALLNDFSKRQLAGIVENYTNAIEHLNRGNPAYAFAFLVMARIKQLNIDKSLMQPEDMLIMSDVGGKVIEAMGKVLEDEEKVKVIVTSWVSDYEKFIDDINSDYRSLTQKIDPLFEMIDKASDAEFQRRKKIFTRHETKDLAVIRYKAQFLNDNIFGHLSESTFENIFGVYSSVLRRHSEALLRPKGKIDGFLKEAREYVNQVKLQIENIEKAKREKFDKIQFICFVVFFIAVTIAVVLAIGSGLL